MPDSKLILACATQCKAHYFHRATLLGRSLQTFPECIRPKLVLLSDNKGSSAIGLPAFYNRVIESADPAAILVFIHDDVFVHDWCLHSSLALALDEYDIVGVVGSAAVPYGQVGWWHDLNQCNQLFRNDSVIKSGSLNHFDPSLVRPDWYGDLPMSCDLLDGVFLAARASVLHTSKVCFDPQFGFHCYDADFCYSAKKAGLRLGTWPIPLTHGSAGNFGDSWVKSAQLLKVKLQRDRP